MKKFLISALVGFGAIYSATSASAAITFEFNQVITSAIPAGGPLYATLTMSNAGANTVNFTMFNASDPTVSGGQFISKLFLNIDPFVAGMMTWTDPQIIAFEFDEDKQGDSGAKFDYTVDFARANQGNRFLAGQTVNWTVTAAGLTESDFVSQSAGSKSFLGLIHIQEIPGIGPSAKVAAVPEPASLTALGLGALALFRRRKRK